MLTFSPRDVLAIAPELECDAIDSDVMANLISNTLLEFSSPDGVATEQAKRLAILRVADMATQYLQRKNGGAAGPSGPLQSVAVGGVSKSFSDPVSMASLSTASSLGASNYYAREFIRLARLWGSHVRVV